MAAVTGSTTIDWSLVSLAQVDFTAHFVTFLNRVDQIVTAIKNPSNYVIISGSPTKVVLDLASGGRLTIQRSQTTYPYTGSFTFINPATGEELHYAARVPNSAQEFMISGTFGSAGFSETIKGSIFVPDEFPPTGNVSGTVTSLVVKVGSATVTFSGTLNMTGDLTSANLTGTVTGIAVVSGTNTIKMTGLAIDIDVIEAAFASNALSTVSDLFSVVGNQLNGDDLITYTNNSGVGMSFFGGAGNDTINISGIRGDTLNGGAGNDILAGGLGQDTVNGEAGDDQITMLVTAGNVDTIDAGADTDMLVLSGAVGGNGLVVVDLSATDQVVSIAGDPNRDNQIQTGFEGVNGVLLGSAMTVTGSAGDNVIIGSNGADTIDGGAGNDTLHGGAGNDQLIGGTGNDVLNGGTGNDTMTGGLGDDTYVIDNLGDQITELSGEGTDTVQINRMVDLNVAPFTEIENVVLTGVAALNATGDGGANSLTGNSAANTLTGGDGNDTLTGGLGNDTLNGGTGDDAMNGGAGNDAILVGDATEHGVGEGLDGGTGTDVLRFTSMTDDQTLVLTNGVTGIEQVVIANAAGLSSGTTDLNVDASAVTSGLLMTGNAGDNELTGTGSNDILNGGAGDDTLDGGAGTNLLIGGKGDDTFIVNTATDLVSEGLNGGIDTVEAAINYVLGANVENLELTGNLGINGTGNALNNSITGNDEANVLTGGAGNDTLEGEAGADTVLGGIGNDRIVMDVAVGHVDTADGGIGLDTLALVGTVPGGGIVTVDLGVGDQVTHVDGAGETLVQNNFENLDASGLNGTVTATGSAGANLLIGSDGADTLGGLAGNDILNGGAGDDTLDSGDGNDVILIADQGDHAGGEVVAGGTGTDVVRFTNTTDGQTLVLTNGVTGIEAVVIANAAGLTTGTTDLNVDASAVTGTGLLIVGNAGDNLLTGTGFNDILNGGAGDDTLNGGGGTNLLIGGTGDDTFIVATPTDLASEGLNGGIDTVVASLNYTLGANIENLTLTGGALTGTGNALNNVLTGNGGINTLTGGAGHDTYIVQNETDSVVELLNAGIDLVQSSVTFTLGANVEQLTLTGADDINGSGNALNNILTGNSGANILTGGLGNDVYVVQNTTDSIVENANEGVDLVQSTAANFTLGANVEHLALLGSGDIDGAGNALNNILTGNEGKNQLSGGDGDDVLNGGGEDDLLLGGAGNDQLLGGAGDDELDGGTGNDRMTGGLGDDEYVVDSAGDVITEGVNAGIDEVTASVSYVLGTNLEDLELTGVDGLSGIGNSLANRITGNSGTNTLLGLAGNDIMDGNVGNDILRGGSGNDTLIGGEGNDFLIGESGDDTFVFGEGDGADILRDNSGTADKLLFDFGIDPLDLVITREANNLRLTIGNSTDSVMIENWYLSTANRTETIQAGNGQVLLTAQVDQLIQAMAAFTTQTGLSWDAAAGGVGTAEQQAQFQGDLAANWQ